MCLLKTGRDLWEGGYSEGIGHFLVKIYKIKPIWKYFNILNIFVSEERSFSYSVTKSLHLYIVMIPLYMFCI